MSPPNGIAIAVHIGISASKVKVKVHIGLMGGISMPLKHFKVLYRYRYPVNEVHQVNELHQVNEVHQVNEMHQANEVHHVNEVHQVNEHGKFTKSQFFHDMGPRGSKIGFSNTNAHISA